jgi:CRISPR-associated protein Cas1
LARIPLEDIAHLIIDHQAVTLTASVLSQCADAGISVITVGPSHIPNAMLTPFLPHSRALKVIRAQLAASIPTTKRLWQRLIQQKIANQAALLLDIGEEGTGERLRHMAGTVRSGDPQNLEAQAARIYFRALWGHGFRRGPEGLTNIMLNYGYAVVRSALARALVCHGFLPALGLHHRSEQNAFNLADDLIEPYRPLVDRHVRAIWLDIDSIPAGLSPHIKGQLVSLLHRDVRHGAQPPEQDVCSTVLASTEALVISLAQVLLTDAPPQNLKVPKGLLAQTRTS